MADVIIRQAVPEDAEDIFEIEQICFPDPWSLDSIHYELEENPRAFYVVAIHNSKVVGYAGLWECVKAMTGKKLTEPEGEKFGLESEVPVRFDGIPVLNPLDCGARANDYTEVLGIVNGTTNYILHKMSTEGMSYEDALKDAQEKGFAEADPTADVEGIDAANKLSILMALMFGKYVHPDDIPTTGISSITHEQIEEAKANDCVIKLIAHATVKEDGDIDYEVRPTYIRTYHPLAGVLEEYNAVYVKGNLVGKLMFYGPGAGPLPTGSAVLGDVMEIAKTMDLQD